MGTTFNHIPTVPRGKLMFSTYELGQMVMALDTRWHKKTQRMQEIIGIQEYHMEARCLARELQEIACLLRKVKAMYKASKKAA